MFLETDPYDIVHRVDNVPYGNGPCGSFYLDQSMESERIRVCFWRQSRVSRLDDCHQREYATVSTHNSQCTLLCMYTQYIQYTQYIHNNRHNSQYATVSTVSTVTLSLAALESVSCSQYVTRQFVSSAPNQAYGEAYWRVT